MARLFFLVALCLSQGAFAQLGPLSGSQPKSFSTVPNDLGFLANSVNAFTGQVQFTIPITAVSSQNGLSYPVSISYNSANMENLVSTWNREAPTGVLGLGWSLEVPRIVADHKSTGTRKDDEFFLIEGGVTRPLLYTSTAGSFYTSRYTNWTINYNETNEVWTIIKEDGTVYTYGDRNSGRKTVRYMVKWGNWIGNSSQPTNQAQTVYIWDLSEITDRWSNKLLFEYQQTEEYVAAGNGAAITTEKQHTKASYIKEIRNTYNEKVVFQYINKAAGEFKDPHNERPEPDPYQEKYETLALDKVQNYVDGNLAGEVRFAYSSMGTAELTKRTLISLTTFSRLGNSLACFLFTYETLTTANYGALKQVTSPLKGTANFTYTKVSLSRTSLAYTIPADGNYSEPQIFFGSDYVVITRRDATGGHSSDLRNTIVHVLTWDAGVWIQSDQFNIGNTRLFGTDLVGGNNPHRQEFKVTLGSDFFAILPKKSGSVYLFKKDEHQNGKWFLNSNHSVHASDNQTLLSGTDFVFVGNKEASFGSVFLFSWVNGQWVKTTYATSTTSGSQYFYTAANNYVLIHEDTKNLGIDWVTLLYKSPSSTTWSTNGAVSIFSTNGSSNWYGAGSYAVMMAAGTSEHIFSWNENYALTWSTLGVAVNDNSFVNNINNSMVLISTVPPDVVKGVAWRYDGLNWISSGDIDYFGPNIYLRNLFSSGDDFVIRPRGANGYLTSMRSFDPGLRSWSTPFEFSTTGLNSNVLLAGNDFVTTAGRFYFKNPDALNAWVQDPQIVNSLNTTGSDFYLQGGLDFIGSGVFAANFSILVRRKNGALIPNADTSIPGLIKDRANVLFGPVQIGYNSVVTGLGGVTQMEDATTLRIFRKVGNNFEGSISAYVATAVEFNDGSSPVNRLNFEYHLPTAAVDASGTVPHFNKVKSYRGTGTTEGYTISYFYNGIDPSVLNTLDPGAHPAVFANHKNATGSLYRSAVFNGSNAEVASSQTTFGFFNFGPGNRSYQILPVTSSQNNSGQVVTQTIAYNAQALPSSSTQVNGPVNSYQYFNEVYPSVTPALYVPVYETSIKNGAIIGVQCVRWKLYGTIYAPFETYTWRNGTTLFSYWNHNTNVLPSEWRLTSRTINYNTRGLVTESIDANGVRKAVIYHATKPIALAEATRAAANQVLYEGFEYATANTSTDALTGAKSSSVAYTVTLPSAGTYQLTYWRKVGTGNWEFITQTIAANTVIGGAGILLDEVRLHPVGALMTTYSYDAWGNLISACDSNNIATHFEYDEYNRKKITRDENRNIVAYEKQNIKN